MSRSRRLSYSDTLRDTSERDYLHAHKLTGDNQRHLRDDHIKAIGDRGGVIGLNLFSKFLVPDGRATIDDCVAHVEHVCELMGHRKGVGLGSDADGGFAANALPVDLDHPRKYGALLEPVQEAGWSDADLQGFCCANWTRVSAKALPST
ncbi:MAG: membrane dipeptidase [Planctomycetes bacterium]|nr:membrane dipeptidase [Planctomycetota bacterium]